MADIIKNENFTADVLLNLLSETTDDYLYMWEIGRASCRERV